MACNDTRAGTEVRLLKVFLSDLLILAALLLGLELALRLVAPQPLQRMLRHVYVLKDGKAFYRPGARALCNMGFGDHEFAVNRWGVRDREYGAKQPGEWRILALGDSFNENQALPVEDIYTEVLERDLAATYPDRAFSVINAGRWGWGLWDYHDYLAEMLPRIEPDVVIIAVGILGDGVRDAEQRPPPRPRMLWGGFPVAKRLYPVRRVGRLILLAGRALESHSHAYVAYRRLTDYPRHWLGISRMPRLHRICTDPQAAAEIEAPTAALVWKIKSLCARHGARLAVLGVPRDYECRARVRRWRVLLENPNVAAFDPERPRRLLARIASVAGTPLYDPWKDLAASEKPTYFPVFAHWNTRGNQIVAAGLRRFLAHQGLLGPMRRPMR